MKTEPTDPWAEAGQAALEAHNVTPIHKRVTRVPMFVDSDVDMKVLREAVERAGLAIARDRRDPWKLIVSRAPSRV